MMQSHLDPAVWQSVDGAVEHQKVSLFCAWWFVHKMGHFMSPRVLCVIGSGSCTKLVEPSWTQQFLSRLPPGKVCHHWEIKGFVHDRVGIVHKLRGSSDIVSLCIILNAQNQPVILTLYPVLLPSTLYNIFSRSAAKPLTRKARWWWSAKPLLVGHLQSRRLPRRETPSFLLILCNSRTSDSLMTGRHFAAFLAVLSNSSDYWTNRLSINTIDTAKAGEFDEGQEDPRCPAVWRAEWWGHFKHFLNIHGMWFPNCLCIHHMWPTLEAAEKAFYEWIDAEFPADPAVSGSYGTTPVHLRIAASWRLHQGPTALSLICKRMALLCFYALGNFLTGWTMGCVEQAMETLFMKSVID